MGREIELASSQRVVTLRLGTLEIFADDLEPPGQTAGESLWPFLWLSLLQG